MKQNLVAAKTEEIVLNAAPPGSFKLSFEIVLYNITTGVRCHQECRTTGGNIKIN